MIKKDVSRLTVGDITDDTFWNRTECLKEGKYSLTGVQKNGEKLPEYEHDDLEHIVAVVEQSILDRSSGSYMRQFNRHIVIESSENVLHVRLGYGSKDNRSPGNYLHEIKIEVKND
ncbi:hypothetical protein phiST2_0121 [Vibrio phage phi-ST2]|nr:hypothetical protein phiST2_0121 [Vibrio phage phi-ST2]